MISNNFYQNETRTIVPSEQERFIKFQCRARQMIMRDNFGKPDESIISSSDRPKYINIYTAI